MKISKRTCSLFLFLVILHASHSQGQGDIVPNIAAFPDGPPAPGDIFEEPAEVTIANEQSALNALGDTSTESPTLLDSTPPPNPVLDAAEALPSDPSVVKETTDVPPEPPSANEEKVVEPKPTTRILSEGIIETVQTAEGVTPFVESGPDVVSMGDGVMAVENPETTTSIIDVAMTTVDSNFDPKGTFDGRNDPILLTGTTSPINSSKVQGNVNKKSTAQDEVVKAAPKQITDVAETLNEIPTGIETETTTASLVLETENVLDEAGSTGINDANEQVNTALDILTPEAISDITELTSTARNGNTTNSDLNAVDSNNVPSTNDIENTAEKPTLVDQTTPSEFMDVSTATGPNYEEKLNEFKEFVKKNPNTKFPAPPVPPPRKPQTPQLPRETTTPSVVLDEITVVPTTDPSLIKDTKPLPSESIIRSEPSKPSLKTDSVAREPPLKPSDPLLPKDNVAEEKSRLPSNPLLPKENLVKQKSLLPSKPKDNVTKEKTLLPSKPTLGLAEVAPSNTGPKPKSPTISRPRIKAPSNTSPELPPPPSAIFRKDFNENTNQKANILKYEPAIPFDPDFDFKPNRKTKTTNQIFTLVKTTNAPSSGQLDIQSIYDSNSRENKAYPFALDEARKRQQASIPRQRDGGMSLIQYQLNNKNEVALARRFNTRESRNNPDRVGNQIRDESSNDMQASFEKRNFLAKFGEPGMPISSDYFNQNQNQFNGGQTYNANRANTLRNQQFETVWAPSGQVTRLKQNSNLVPSYERSNTMPPIVVVEDGSTSDHRNIVSDRKLPPVSVGLKQSQFKDINIAKTNAPYIRNNMGNSYEIWYQLMEKDFQKNDIKNLQNGLNSGSYAREMGGRVINRFWSDANYMRDQIGQDSRLRDVKVNNELFGKRAGGIQSTKVPKSSQSQKAVQKSNSFVFKPQRQTLQTENTKTIAKRNPAPPVMNNNAFVFNPKRQRFQIQNTEIVQRREPAKHTVPYKNNAFEFEPQKQQFQVDVTKDARRQLNTQNTARKQNAVIFEPQLQRSQIEVTEPYRMRIKEYLVTGKPNTVSTTEARLNTGVPTLSYSSEPGMFSQDNPPPINVDGKFDNIAFQSFITTTERPNSLLRPSMISSSALRNRQRNAQTLNGSLRKSVASIADLPHPPPIKPSFPTFSNTLKNNAEINSVLSQKDKDMNVEPKLNAVPFVPAEPMRGPKISKISDLPRPPAIKFAGSGGSGTGKDSNLGLAPIAGAQLFRDIPEVTPVPPLFSVNSTIVMKLQNDSVTKDELPSSICHQCHYVSDVCFLSEAEICNRFVECHRNGDQVRAFEKECAIGNFWNPETLACQKSVYVNCSSDPCKNPAVKSHPFLGRCRYFWKCDRRTSEFKFCSQNYRYDGIADTCVPDFSCKDEDPPMDVVQPTVPGKCLWTAVDGTLTSFTDGFSTQKCAPGTRFDEEQCTCITSNITPEGEVCNPDTLIDFEGDELEAFMDKSGHRNGIGRENVRLKDGTGFFYGVGKLSFWRYSNVELGPLLGIQIRFFPYGYSKNPMGLVSNCNGSPIGATVDIRLDTKTKQAIFKLSTNKQRNNEIALPYEPFKWNTATYVYAGDTFTASINDKKETIPVEGSIPNRHPAIQIGGCNRQDGFRGYADDVKVYNGCIPDEFEYIIFT